MNKLIKCPTCQKEKPWDKNNSYRPFCSERCRLIDLGEWADEGHRIPGETAYFDEDSLYKENEH